MKDNSNEFRASSVDLAIEQGLKTLGLTKDDVNIEVKSKGNIFSKATVIITPKAEVEASVLAVDNESIVEEAVTSVEEEIELTADLNKKYRDEDITAEPKEVIPENLLKAENKAIDFVGNLVSMMGNEVTISSTLLEREINIDIKGDDTASLIGYRGEILDALQYLTSLVVNGRDDGKIKITVDTENYREKRRNTLINLAEKLAKKASYSGMEQVLEPMNPYERRIIHSALQDSPLATTRSDGQGRDRHIVIIPLDGNAIDDSMYGNSTNFRKNGMGKTRSFGYQKKRF